MCLCPTSVINPKKLISLQGGHPFVMQVPCGKCAECNDKKVDEYMLRSYYETFECHKKGGFVLFDTLTYADSNLPHLSDSISLLKNTILDYPCFSRRHIRLFFVLLRRRLELDGFAVSDNLKYFLSSEYGTSELCTHRPHYHILFYCTIPNLTPIQLSIYISSIWSYGRTDGCPYKSSEYVLQNRVACAGDSFTSESFCRYVSKYVVKQSSFEKVIDARVECLYSRLMFDYNQSQKFVPSELYRNSDPDFVKMVVDLIDLCDVDAKKILRRYISRLCCQFHRQSLHFGESALTYNNLDEVFESGMMSFPTSNDVVKHIPLPIYFARKLFYSLSEDFRGVKCWKLNDLGVKYKISRIHKNVEMLSTRIKDFVDNNNLVSEFDKSLDGRSYFDFATYIMLYKGRLHGDSVESDLSLDDWLYRQFFPTYKSSFMYNYTSSRDRQIFDGEPVLTNRWVGDSQTGVNLPKEVHDYEAYVGTRFYVDPCMFTMRDYHYVWYRETSSLPYQKELLRDFIKRRVISQNYCYAFRGFDDLYLFYCSHLYKSNISKQLAYDKKIELQERRKTFKNLHYV